jgi:hypothetical protein
MSSSPAEALKRLADEVATGKLSLPVSTDALVNLGLAETAYADALTPLSTSLGRKPFCDAVRAMAQVVDAASASRASLVLTDSFDEVEGRDSSVVLSTLIRSATRTLTLTGYSWGHWTPAGDAPGHPLFEVVARHRRNTPGLKVRLLLHLARNEGESDSAAHARFDHTFWRYLWPWPDRPDVFVDTARRRGDSGLLHAKVVIADSTRLLVTSANLTASALERSIEAGVLLHDALLAGQMEAHLDDLVRRGVLAGLTGPAAAGGARAGSG